MNTRESKKEDAGAMARNEYSTIPQSGSGRAQSKTLRRFVALLALAALPLFSMFAQQFSIDWFTIDGGGGTSTGGVFSVSATIGQPDAGPAMTGGNSSLTGGFWALYAVPTPGAPRLTVTPAGAGQATISWTPTTAGFALQECPSLSIFNWTNSPSGTTNPITVPVGLGNKFYRLKTP